MTFAGFLFQWSNDELTIRKAADDQCSDHQCRAGDAADHRQHRQWNHLLQFSLKLAGFGLPEPSARWRDEKRGGKRSMSVIVGNRIAARTLKTFLNAGLATFLIASVPLARAQSIITSETTHVTLIAAPQSGGGLVLTATVSADHGGGVPGGTLKFIDEANGRLLGLTDVARPSIVIDRFAPGEHRIRVDYSGTTDYLPVMVQRSHSAVLVHQQLTRPAVTVSSSGNPSTPGEVVTLTAVVSGHDAAPKGNVTFRDGPHILAHVGLDRGGIASFTTSALADGARAVTAEYEGDGAYAPAVSPRLMQDVAAVNVARTQRDR